MEIFKNLNLVLIIGRIITILPLALIITLIMGKRSIGELPVFDFLVIITLGAVIGADIADPEIKHLPTAIAIILIGMFQFIVSMAKIKFRKFGHAITFEPTIVIQDGQFIVNNLKKIRYSIDNILQMMREKDVFDIKEIHLGIVEANGNLSVLKTPAKASITIEDMNITKKNPSLTYPVIIEGNVYLDVLNNLNLSNDWLTQQLNNLKIKDTKDVFFASVNDKKELHVSLKSYMRDKEGILSIYH